MRHIYLICFKKDKTKTPYWMQLQLWMQNDLLNMGIFMFTEPEQGANYSEYYRKHIEDMMDEVQQYPANWNGSLDEIIAELLEQQIIFAYENDYIALYDPLHTEISKLDLFLDAYKIQIAYND